MRHRRTVEDEESEHDETTEEQEDADEQEEAEDDDEGSVYAYLRDNDVFNTVVLGGAKSTFHKHLDDAETAAKALYNAFRAGIPHSTLKENLINVKGKFASWLCGKQYPSPRLRGNPCTVFTMCTATSPKGPGTLKYMWDELMPNILIPKKKEDTMKGIVGKMIEERARIKGWSLDGVEEGEGRGRLLDAEEPVDADTDADADADADADLAAPMMRTTRGWAKRVRAIEEEDARYKARDEVSHPAIVPSCHPAIVPSYTRATVTPLV
jgi:hypothetical protein